MRGRRFDGKRNLNLGLHGFPMNAKKSGSPQFQGSHFPKECGAELEVRAAPHCAGWKFSYSQSLACRCFVMFATMLSNVLVKCVSYLLKIVPGFIGTPVQRE